MAAYLTVHPPVRDQWYERRTRALTGCTVLHSAENAFDEIGADNGAEGVAEFCRTRTTPGSYHDIVDSDTAIYLVDYVHGAYHDGTGSNNWALSLSFAVRTIDWARMTATKRAAILRQGALRFVAQQQWRKANGFPLTRLRYITKAQSDAGESGLCCHGWRDPGRRSDPGVNAPDLFPFDEFLAACGAALGELMPDHPDALEDDMANSDLILAEVRAVKALLQPGKAGVASAGPVWAAISEIRADVNDVVAQVTEIGEDSEEARYALQTGKAGERPAGPVWAKVVDIANRLDALAAELEEPAEGDAAQPATA